LRVIDFENDMRVKQGQEKRSDYRTCVTCAMIMNAMTKKQDGTAFEPADFYPFFASLIDGKEAKAAAAAKPKRFVDMDTADQVAHLMKGFGRSVPERFRAAKGLDAAVKKRAPRVPQSAVA
jgi:hypothetical protein